MTVISTKLLYTIGHKFFADMKLTLCLRLDYYSENIICERIATCTLRACTSHVARVHKNLIIHWNGASINNFDCGNFSCYGMHV